MPVSVSIELPMRRLLLALGLFLAAAACAGQKGAGCEVSSDCATTICCLTCGAGPCQGSTLGLCCAGTCDADGGCPAGSFCDGGICL
ncbi:MAG: hypothetical protein ACYDCL_07305 [Myxococcales bacterium]